MIFPAVFCGLPYSKRTTCVLVSGPYCVSHLTTYCSSCNRIMFTSARIGLNVFQIRVYSLAAHEMRVLCAFGHSGRLYHDMYFFCTYPVLACTCLYLFCTYLYLFVLTWYLYTIHGGTRNSIRTLCLLEYRHFWRLSSMGVYTASFVCSFSGYHFVLITHCGGFFLQERRQFRPIGGYHGGFRF